MSKIFQQKSVLLRRKPFTAWKEFLFADSLRSLRLGGECGTPLSPRRREGRKEYPNKANLRFGRAGLIREIRGKFQEEHRRYFRRR